MGNLGLGVTFSRSPSADTIHVHTISIAFRISYRVRPIQRLYRLPHSLGGASTRSVTTLFTEPRDTSLGERIVNRLPGLFALLTCI